DTLTAAGLVPTHAVPAPVRPARLHVAAYRRHLQTPTLGVVGFAAEFSYLKGADALPGLIAACAPEFAFRIAGRGPLGGRIRSSVNAFDSARRSRVALTDRVPPAQMDEFFGAVDAVLVLSRTESQCRLAIEAMFAGVVVLARPVEAVRDLVDDGRTGFYIDPEDPCAVGHLLRRLRSDPALVYEVRRQARELAYRVAMDSERAWPSLICDLLGISVLPSMRGGAPLLGQPAQLVDLPASRK
ncbi:MAG: 1,2-diacylglycerol 3-alpha-glucosyltransferase, partial [Pseudonocardiales bacterium]|nr:1,2-diacylglycerol 3-alpha-glucosyltransferase [Pseudonocardiales bacterium]